MQCFPALLQRNFFNQSPPPGVGCNHLEYRSSCSDNVSKIGNVHLGEVPESMRGSGGLHLSAQCWIRHKAEVCCLKLLDGGSPGHSSLPCRSPHGSQNNLHAQDYSSGSCSSVNCLQIGHVLGYGGPVMLYTCWTCAEGRMDCKPLSLCQCSHASHGFLTHYFVARQSILHSVSLWGILACSVRTYTSEPPRTFRRGAGALMGLSAARLPLSSRSSAVLRPCISCLPTRGLCLRQHG